MYRYVPKSSDPGARVLSYDIVNKPTWADFAETNGELSGTPTADDVGSTANIEIGVSDGTRRGSVGPFRIKVVAQDSDAATGATGATTITGTSAAVITAGQHYSFRPDVTDPSGETLNFAIVNRPAWAAFNTLTGELSGTPTSANVGTSTNIIISVIGGDVAVALTAFSLRVAPADDNAPTISGTPAATVAAGGDYAFTPVAGDPDGNPLTFSILNAPSWANFSASTGRLAGTVPASAAGSIHPNIVISASDGNLTASLPAFSIQVHAQAAGGPVTPVAPVSGARLKFTPGHYMELDNNAGVANWLAAIKSLASEPNVVGVFLIVPWSRLEYAENVYTHGSGDSVMGFALVDELVAACAAAGKQFMIAYSDRSFGGPQTYSSPTSFGALPAYFDTLNTASGAPGYIEAPSGTTWDALQVIAKSWDPAVTARAIALVKAYGARYDSNPNFEMFGGPETAIAAPNAAGGFSPGAYLEQLQVWMRAARAAFPTTQIRMSANYLGNISMMQQLTASMLENRITDGGPDTAPGRSLDANVVFNGQQGGKSYINTLPWVSEMEYPELTASLGGPFSASALYNYAMTGTASKGGSMKPQYFLWFDNTYAGPSGDYTTWPQILAYINSINGAVNRTRPSAL